MLCEQRCETRRARHWERKGNAREVGRGGAAFAVCARGAGRAVWVRYDCGTVWRRCCAVQKQELARRRGSVRRQVVAAAREKDESSGLSGFAKLVADENASVWKSRRRGIRTALALAGFVRAGRKKLPKKADGADREREQKAKTNLVQDAQTTAVVTAFAVAFGAIVLRFGGRAAFVSAIGLDIFQGADNAIVTQFTRIIHAFEQLHELQFVVLLASWTVCKTFFIDFGSVALAFTAGVLYHDVFLGALVSSTCAALGGLPGFYIGRIGLRERVQKQIEKRPALRVLQTSVARNDFKTVLVLRLSPLLPIPIGAYNYVYGASAVRVLPFLLAILLGSFKPYLLDAYLGVFIADSLQAAQNAKLADAGETAALDAAATQSAMLPASDLTLLGSLAVAVLIGTFASQVAASTWREMQAEAELQMKSNKSAAARSDQDDEPAGESGISLWLRMMGIKESELPHWAQSWRSSSEVAWKNYWVVVEEEHKRILASRNDAQRVDLDITVTPAPPIKADGTVDSTLWWAESILFTPLFPQIVARYSRVDVDKA